MKLSVKSLIITAAILWAFSLFFVGVLNRLFPPYGKAFLEVMSSIYPGYKTVGTLRSVIVGTLYALVDGAIAGALFAWIYNAFVGAIE